MNVRYIIISPARNEQRYIEKTIRSVVSQTIKPLRWVIVNDGSTDNTEDIIRSYSQNHPWIQLINKPDRGLRELGGGVIEAFNTGYDLIKDIDYDFIIKLDVDLSFESNYFEKLFKKFKKNPKLGIAGGSCYTLHNGKPKIEEAFKYHVRGPTKIYRRECFEDIGGLIPILGWDGIDEMKAQMKGWKTKSFKEFTVIHHRPTGHEAGLLRTRISQGIACYVMGYSPIFILLRTICKMLQRPCIIGSILTLLSFIRCYFDKNINHIDDKDLIKFVRRKQINRLLFRDTKT